MMVFFNVRGIIMVEYVPLNQMVNQQFYNRSYKRYKKVLKNKKDQNCGVVEGFCTETTHWHTSDFTPADISWKTNTNAQTCSILNQILLHVTFLFPQNWKVHSKEPIFSQVKTSIRVTYSTFTKLLQEMLQSLEGSYWVVCDFWWKLLWRR
jgi:hypothetical protein